MHVKDREGSRRSDTNAKHSFGQDQFFCRALDLTLRARTRTGWVTGSDFGTAMALRVQHEHCVQVRGEPGLPRF